MELNHRFQGYISLDLDENISIFIKRLWDSSLGLYRHMSLEKRFFPDMCAVWSHTKNWADRGPWRHWHDLLQTNEWQFPAFSSIIPGKAGTNGISGVLFCAISGCIFWPVASPLFLALSQ